MSIDADAFRKNPALFVWAKIRRSIEEYQTHLIDSVKEDIKHEIFKTQYCFYEAYHICRYSIYHLSQAQ